MRYHLNYLQKGRNLQEVRSSNQHNKYLPSLWKGLYPRRSFCRRLHPKLRSLRSLTRKGKTRTSVMMTILVVMTFILMQRRSYTELQPRLYLKYRLPMLKIERNMLFLKVLSNSGAIILTWKRRKSSPSNHTSTCRPKIYPSPRSYQEYCPQALIYQLPQWFQRLYIPKLSYPPTPHKSREHLGYVRRNISNL